MILLILFHTALATGNNSDFFTASGRDNEMLTCEDISRCYKDILVRIRSSECKDNNISSNEKTLVKHKVAWVRLFSCDNNIDEEIYKKFLKDFEAGCKRETYFEFEPLYKIMLGDHCNLSGGNPIDKLMHGHNKENLAVDDLQETTEISSVSFKNDVSELIDLEEATENIISNEISSEETNNGTVREFQLNTGKNNNILSYNAKDGFKSNQAFDLQNLTSGYRNSDLRLNDNGIAADTNSSWGTLMIYGPIMILFSILGVVFGLKYLKSKATYLNMRNSAV